MTTTAAMGLFEKVKELKVKNRLDMIVEDEGEQFLIDNPDIDFEIALVEEQLSALHLIRVDKKRVFPIGYSLDDTQIYFFFDVDKFMRIK